MFMLTDMPVMIGGLGIVLAVTSFISGLQLVKSKSASIEGTIHRTNGYFTVILFFVLAVMAVWNGKATTASFIAPFFGLGVFLVKLWIVRRGRSLFKYVSWAGGCLILTWLFIYYHHIPA